MTAEFESPVHRLRTTPQSGWVVLKAAFADRMILLLALLLVVGVVVLIVHQQWQHNELVEATALEEAERYSGALRKFRTLYTSEVVQTVEQSQHIEVTHDYDQGEKKGRAIPLPATLSMLLGKEMAGEHGGDTKLYSKYPFPYPGRLKLEQRDAFAQDAWRQLTASPDEPFFRYESVEGRRMLRYATADRMRESCVHCHNNHDDTPKDDWKVGDVRGVLEVSLPLDAATQRMQSSQSQSFALIVGFGAAGLIALVIVIGGMRRNSLKLESRVERRTEQLATANASLAQSNEAIQNSEALYHSLVDHLPINVTRKNLEGRITFVNRPFCELVGMTSDELVGKTDYDLSPPELADKYRRDDQHVATTGEVIHSIEENRDHDQAIYFEVWKVPIRDTAGKIVETQALFWDVTQRERAEQELRIARQAADVANRAKSDFLANMSHEIRTPMNAIIGMTELALESDLSTTQREYLSTVRESGNTLLSLINNILDFSKIEAGKLDLVHDPFQLREHVGDTLKLLAVRADDAGLELAWWIDPDVPDALIGDLHRIRQVLVNLIGNAIKFTEQGEVVLEVSCRSRDDEKVVLEFAVRDTGVGIPQDKQDTIFSAFEQADTSSTRRFSGTGLGLAISSRIIELMDGDIRVESQVGKGSTFFFSAGFTLGDDTAAAEPDTSRIRGIQVLVVDDNATNRRILGEVLSNWGMQPTMVAGAESALAALRQAHQSGQQFPLVLSDVNMPEIDGVMLAERIRADANLHGTTIMMLTSGDRLSELAHHEELGIVCCLMKPIKQSELLDGIVSALGVGATAGLPSGQLEMARVEELPPLNILLVEDSVPNQKLAAALLEKRGHAVVVVNNGREALALLDAGAKFDVVLMDVQMPEMDGIEATLAIREREKKTEEHLQIIAMTAHAMIGDRERCLAAGMDEYVSKPIRPAELMGRIAQCLAGRRSPTAASVDTSSQHGDLNWPAALEMTEGDRELLTVIVSSILEEWPGILQQLEEAVTNSDAQVVQRAAHTIGGTMRGFRAEELINTATRLEQLGQSSELDGANELIQALKKQMKAIAKELTTFIAEAGTP